jgi:YVTN family beta-propeller protein
VAVDPTTHLVYVVSGPGGQGFISVFSGASNLPRVFGPSLIDPTAITVNPTTGDVYIADSFPAINSTVWVVNAATNLVSPVNVNTAEPVGVAVDPVTDNMYVPDRLFNMEEAWHLSPLDFVIGIELGATPSGVAVNPAKGLVYTAYTNDQISVISEATNTVTRTIPVGSGPAAIAVDTTTGKVLVANAGAGTVSVLNG